MKTIKPQKLGVLTQVFENDRQFHLVASILVFFPFEAPTSLLPEVSLWKFAAAELGKDAALDMFMSKVRGEVLVTGKAYAFGGVPRPACSVRVRIGAVSKELYVVGDRHWERNGSSPPVPFVEMPVSWENAFGGASFPQNPVGKGAAPPEDKGKPHMLPNVEDPKHLIRSPKDRPAPAGFGPFDPTWPQRFSKVGTYDAEWLETRFPGYAKDMDYGFFNAAPVDQQIEGYFRGDEPFTVENMHPTKPVLEAHLPGVRTRCFITKRTPDGDVFGEIPMRLDTVRLFPHAERGLLIFRGVSRVLEDDAADVLNLVAACEAMDVPKPVGHYEHVLAQRLDKKTGVLYSLRDKDLMPDLPRANVPLAEDAWNDTAPLLKNEALQQKNFRRRAEAALANARAECIAAGIDPAGKVPEALPPVPPEPSLDDIADYVEKVTAERDLLVADAEVKRAASEKRARAECAAQGVDYDKLVADAKGAGGGPPKFSADAELEKLRDVAELSRNAGVPIGNVSAQLADPALEQKLRTAEKGMRDAYRKFAHHFPAAKRLEGEPAARLRAEVTAARAAGESLSGRDLTGADLSELDLAGSDLHDAMLEAANLRGARLAGANLAGAALARADLSAADLRGANLAGTNLGLASLRGATLVDADLTGATLAKADLRDANFAGAKMAKADFAEVQVEGASFRGVFAQGITFFEVDLSGAEMAEADLSKCLFFKGNVAGVDFSGANLGATAFCGVKGDGAVFRKAVLENLRVVMESSFAGADFRDARLMGANLRGTNLAGADFTGVDMTGADLSECDLRGAKLARVSAADSRLTKADLTNAVLTSANLMQGILNKAKLHGADLRGANLFRADLARIRADKTTDLTGANVKQARVVALRPNDKG